MKKSKDKNTIVYVFLLIIVLFTLLIAAVITTIKIDMRNKNSGSDLKFKFDLNGENYTKDELIRFLETAKECKNYKFEFEESGNKVTGVMYENKIHYSNNYEDTYYNFSSKKMVVLNDTEKTIQLLDAKLDDKYKNVLANVMLVFLNCDESKIKFIKHEKYKDFNCIVERISLDDVDKIKELGLFSEEQVELIKKYEDQKVKINYEFWIDEKTGLLPRYDVVIESVEKKENRIEYDTNLVVGQVTENDIVFPTEEEYSQKGYKVIK